MLGKSNDPNDSQTSGVLIQYLREISVYLKEINISKKTTILAAAVLVLAGLLGVHYREEGTILPTSSSVGGRELPIYCVQTEEPKIALTFDAAWGNDDTKKIMEILKKHDVKVTFFMTGGWVEATSLQGLSLLKGQGGIPQIHKSKMSAHKYVRSLFR